MSKPADSFVRCWPVLAALAALAAAPCARADSSVGVDLQLGNKLDPTGGIAVQSPDPRGTSWLEPGTHRTPTGYLYMCPAIPPVERPTGDWQYYGVLQLGLLDPGGDRRNALWQRYADWHNGLILGLLDILFERPADGSYVEVRGSRISEHDQYYKLTVGRAGSYRVEAFARDLPDVVSGDARPIWNGIGSNHLTLPSSLPPGASTPAQVAAASAAVPLRTLQVNRSKQGIGISYFFSRQWTGYFNISDEQRKGERPFGGAFFFNFPFPDNGGILETVKPVDDHTVSLSGGLRYAGPVWRLDIGYSGSFYRDRYRSFDYQMPYALTPVVPGTVAAPLTMGQFAMEPDNNYHNLRATLTRKLPWWNGELSLTASGARMNQNDALIAPIACQGVFGIGLNGSLALGPQNPYLFPCSAWNTPAALSRRTAGLGIDESTANARVVLQPGANLTVQGGFKFHREDYRNTYLAYNPLTGQYGYVAENGAQGSIVPGEIGIFDPLLDPSAITRIESLPLDMQTTTADLGIDWKATAHDTLGATYAYSRYEPSHREREHVDDNSIKLTWVNRALSWATFRVNYTFLRQRGDTYDFDPYAFTYSSALPGFVAPPGGVPAYTVDALRKYDLADRDENKLDAMVTLMPRDDMTVSASLRGDWNGYAAAIGRQRYSTLAATLQWEWAPSPDTSASVFYGYDRSKLRLANVNDIADNNPDPTLGGASYPVSGEWRADDRQRNRNLGADFGHRFGRVRFDANWNYLYARGITAYSYASPLAFAYPDTVTGNGPGAGVFPPMVYRINSLTLGLTVPLAARISLRLFDYYERGRISDWHYLGFDQTLVYDHKVYTDGGPQSYSANLIGLLLNIRL